MNSWLVALLLIAIAAGVAAALYGLHRLCLWLEERGWLYYKNKQPSSSGASCFVALQRAIEPESRHVIQVTEQFRTRSEADVPGEGTPPRPVDVPPGTP